ncbi:YihY/virulence factor BrkB family protein [Trueperella bialowiezensis]|uniref:Ribonuclease BN-like family n=1 Tax=Trueperella bialowiezensis TaxID=312285 RepID=A0A448PG86_9ACTO|nr:YihY/virulence factor BrkB family protein [Trueperella bialowiezensis]VEI13926.1 Ribonuclease BN-like family [Trueperella bialowiezensis]
MRYEITTTDKPPAIVAAGTRIAGWVMNLRIVRAFQRYGQARGPQLSGGIAYSALFALASTLTLLLTAFSYTLGGNDELRENLFAAIDSALPGVLKMNGPDSEGIVEPEVLIIDDPLNPATVISSIVLIWSAIGLMTGIRNSVLSMFGLARVTRNPVLAKLADFSGFIVISASVLVTTAAAMAARFFAEPILEFLHFTAGASSFLLSATTFVISFVVDAAVVMFLIRVMAGVRAPLKDLVIGAMVGALGSAALRYLGTSVVGSASNNAIMAGLATAGTLLLLVNFLARLLLISACVTANPPAPGEPTPSQIEHLEETPNYVTESDPRTKQWNYDPISGVIAPDPPESEPEPVPEWTGWKARRARAKVDKARQAAEVATQELAVAEQNYRDGAWAAFHTNTRRTTNRKLAKVEPGDVTAIKEDRS